MQTKPSPIAEPGLVSDTILSPIADAYARRARQLWSFGRRMGLDAEAAEDAMQEAFARAVSQPLCGVAQLDAWLFRVVHNLAVDSHRRTARREVRDISESVAVAHDADLEERVALWQAVDRLPERQRAAVYLRFRADLAWGDVASILGITEAGARSNGARALDQLRKWMDRP